jgi:putative transposase
MPAADMCRQLGCSEASLYLWKKRCGKLGLMEIKELRQLRDENARLALVIRQTRDQRESTALVG